MNTLYIVVDTVAITLMLVIALGFVRSTPSQKFTWLVCWLAASYLCYVLSARQDYAFDIPQVLQLDFGAGYAFINIARNSISAVFLLLAHLLFREQHRLHLGFVALIVIQMILEEPLGWIVTAEWEHANPALKLLLYELVPAALQTVMSLVATYWILAGLRGDLVRTRRNARVLMLLVVVSQGFVSLLVERVGFMSGLVHVEHTYVIHMSLVGAQTVVFAMVGATLLRRDLLEWVSDKAPRTEQTVTADNTSVELEHVRYALEEEKIYRQMGLSVSDLAKHLSIPQHRLRDLIHRGLGFRNFNSFLHHYRIQEVAAALEDRHQNQTPILTLALSAGYQSINPFNRAFKELKGMTPSEYRSAKQADASKEVD